MEKPVHLSSLQALHLACVGEAHFDRISKYRDEYYFMLAHQLLPGETHWRQFPMNGSNLDKHPALMVISKVHTKYLGLLLPTTASELALSFPSYTSSENTCRFRFIPAPVVHLTKTEAAQTGTRLFWE